MTRTRAPSAASAAAPPRDPAMAGARGTVGVLSVDAVEVGVELGLVDSEGGKAEPPTSVGDAPVVVGVIQSTSADEEVDMVPLR